MKRLHSFLILLRPANILTSVADVLGGIAISGTLISQVSYTMTLVPILLICAATACLYGGGIVFNDVFDAELDRVERPERPIPSGAVLISEAAALGGSLLVAGILLAALVNGTAAILAIGIAVFALLYNRFSKHHNFIGPLNMGLCRGLNLLLGISILPHSLPQFVWLAIVPVIYIFSITLISQGEVHGGGKNKLYVAASLYLLVCAAILAVATNQQQAVWAIIFLLPFAWMIFRPLLRAIADPVGRNIGTAVKAGVISLILMDAAWAASFHSPVIAVIIACLLPLSIWLSKKFAVT